MVEGTKNKKCTTELLDFPFITNVKCENITTAKITLYRVASDYMYRLNMAFLTPTTLL